ncbi:hypothetical protein PTKIN_Ptkin15bG0177200 [Pterospermum kingtungense]
MEVIRVKGKAHLCLVILFAVILLLLDTNPCRATSISRMEFFGQNNATVDADNLELEFLHDYVPGRMLADNSVANNVLDPSRLAASCGRGIPYNSCLPQKNKNPPPPGCRPSPYNRNC